MDAFIAKKKLMHKDGEPMIYAQDCVTNITANFWDITHKTNTE